MGALAVQQSMCYSMSSHLPCVFIPMRLDSGISAGCGFRSARHPCLHRTRPLSIIDKERRLIRLSDPSELEGKVGGQPVKILSIKPGERPHRIVILLDTSGSMIAG